MNLGYWIRRPRMAFRRLLYWRWERRNPDKPWLTPGAVAFLESHLAPPMVGLEFGSGRSTPWFAARLGHLTSIEHHAGWAATVRTRLADLGRTNVDHRLIPLDHTETEPERESYDPLPEYVAAVAGFVDRSLEFIAVDGHYRTQCIRFALEKLKPGGLLLVDDANLWPGDAPPVPADWPVVSRTSNGLKITAVWRRPS